MKRKRFTDEQRLEVLAYADRTSSTEATRKYNITKNTFYNWRARFAGLDKSELRKKRGLEDENARLKKLLAESMLDNEILKEAVVQLERLGKS